MPQVQLFRQTRLIFNRLTVITLAAAVAACVGPVDPETEVDVPSSSAPQTTSSAGNSSSVANSSVANSPVASSSVVNSSVASSAPSSAPAAPLVNLLTSSGTFANGQEDFTILIVGDIGSVNWSQKADVTVNSASDNNWHIQIQHAVSVVAGEQYSICLDAKADASRDIVFDIDSGPDDYATLSGDALSVGITSTYQTYKHTFAATKTDSSARLTINLAGDAANTEVDNIGVYQGAVCPEPGSQSTSSAGSESSASSSSASVDRGFVYTDANLTSSTIAAAARSQFDGNCSVCHRYEGSGIFTAAGGDNFDISQYDNDASFARLVDYIDATMPKQAPTSCTSVDNCALNTAAWMIKFLREDSGLVLTAESCQADVPVGYGFRTLRLLGKSEYLNTLQDLQIATPAQLANNDLPPDNLVTKSGFTANTIETVNSARLEKMMSFASDIATASATAFRRRVSCGTNANACSREFLKLAEKMYRRPLSAIESDPLKAVFTQYGAVEGAKVAIKAALTAPQFLYRSELGLTVAEAREQNINLGNNASGQAIIDTLDSDTYILAPYEMATALSYMYTGSTPDDELLTAASNGAVYKAADIQAIASRLMAGNKAKKHMQNFGATWFQADNILSVERPNVSNFTPALKADMAREVRELFGRVFFADGIPFGDLYGGNFSVVNKRLADYYGVQNFEGNNNSWKRTTIPNRSGMITTGAFMALNAGRNGSGPIKRAVALRELMLCHHIGAPPNDLGSDETRTELIQQVLVREEQGDLTQREYFELTTKSESCDFCHKTMINPLFGMDDFDEAGRFRTTQTGRGPNGVEGLQIDNTGQLIGLSSVNDLDNILSFTGSKDLGSKISNLDAVNKCLVTNSFRYATSMPLSEDSYSLDNGGNSNEPVTLTEDQKLSFFCAEQDMLNTLESSDGSAKAVYERMGSLEAVMFRKVIQASQFPNQVN